MIFFHDSQLSRILLILETSWYNIFTFEWSLDYTDLVTIEWLSVDKVLNEVDVLIN